MVVAVLLAEAPARPSAPAGSPWPVVPAGASDSSVQVNVSSGAFPWPDASCAAPGWGSGSMGFLCSVIGMLLVLVVDMVA